MNPDGTFQNFASPWLALLLIPVLAAFIRALLLKPPTLRISQLEPLRQSAPRRVSWLLRIPLALEFFGLCLLVVAMTHPQQGRRETLDRTEGIDIMVALDVSPSMQIYDLPDALQTTQAVYNAMNEGKLLPRIDVAKGEVKRFVESRTTDRVGLVAFASETYTVSPPTLDQGYLTGQLRLLEAGALGQQTGIAAPIASCTTRLKDSQAKRRVMVLITDGEDNNPIEITPLQAAQIAAKCDVIIHTIGLGNERAVQKSQGFFGRTNLVAVDSSFDRGLLKAIAKETGGTYFEAGDDSEFRAVLEQIDAMEKVEMELPQFVDYDDRFAPWLLAGGCLLLLGFLLEHTVLMSVP